MFRVHWNRKCGRKITSNTKEFDDYPKAVEFLRKKKLNIISEYWAGGYVEDTKGRKIYTI